MCLARSPIPRDIRVVYGDNMAPLGVIDLQTCLHNVIQSSPEIMSNINSCDYAVYSTDYTEPGTPLVGHGMLSWLHFAPEQNPSGNMDKESKLVVGRVCTNILALFSGGSKETLEVSLRLKPTSSNTQAQYIKSINLYKSLATFLPANFDHPSWAAFLSQNPNLSRFVKESAQKDFVQSPAPPASRLLGDCRSRQKSTSSPLSLPDIVYESESANTGLPSAYASSPLMYSSLMSNLDSDQITSYSSPQPPYDSSTNTPNFATPGPRATKSRWVDAPTSPIAMSSPPAMNDHEDLHPADDRDQMYPAEECDSLDDNHIADNCEGSHSASDSRSNPSVAAGKDFTVTKERIDGSLNEHKDARLPKKRSLSAAPKARTDSNDGTKTVVARGYKYRQRDRVIKGLYEAVAAGEVPMYCQNCGTVNPSTWRRIKIAESPGNEEKEYLLCNPCGLWYSAKRSMRPPHLWTNHASDKSLAVLSPVEEPPASIKPEKREKTFRRRRGPNKQIEDYVGPSIAELLAQNVRSKSASVSTGLDKDEAGTGDADDTKDNETPEVAHASPVSVANTPDENSNDSGDGKKKQTVKNSGRVTKRTRERKTGGKKSKKTLPIVKGDPVLIAPAPVPGPSQEESKRETFAQVSAPSVAENGISAKLEALANKENQPPIEKDTATQETAEQEPTSPSLTTEQLNFLLTTPKKARRTDSRPDHPDDFEFFTNSNFSGSPSRWISKFLSPNGKSSIDFGFGEISDEAFRAMISPSSSSKIMKHDTFESSLINRDAGIEDEIMNSMSGGGSGEGDSVTPTDFAKLMSSPITDRKSLGSSSPSVASKMEPSSPLENSPVIVRKSNSKSESLPLNKRVKLPSSPPQQFYVANETSYHTSEPPVDIWSDAASPISDDPLTVKISPVPSRD